MINLMMFIIGICIYFGSAWISYDKGFQSNPLKFYGTGLLFSIIANISWLTIARRSPSSSETVLLGLYWDIMLTFVFMAVPLLFFDAQFTIKQIFGVAMIICGIILTKV